MGTADPHTHMLGKSIFPSNVLECISGFLEKKIFHAQPLKTIYCLRQRTKKNSCLWANSRFFIHILIRFVFGSWLAFGFMLQVFYSKICCWQVSKQRYNLNKTQSSLQSLKDYDKVLQQGFSNINDRLRRLQFIMNIFHV